MKGILLQVVQYKEKLDTHQEYSVSAQTYFEVKSIGIFYSVEDTVAYMYISMIF